MKNTIFSAIAALFISAAVNAQTEPAKPQTAEQPKPVKVDTYNNITPAVHVTADAYLPEHLKGATSSTIQTKHFLPVLGTYASAAPVAEGTVATETVNANTANVNVLVDEQNVGIVWVEGLPQGRVKAVLKKSPATYKIPAQKTADGKSVSEGTLYFDPATKQLSICIGCTYNEAEPTAVFASTTATDETTTKKTKSKAKVWQYTGIKVIEQPVQAAPATAPANNQ